MHRVVVGRADRKIVIQAGHCVKSGVPTTEKVVIRGSLLPGWVYLILPFAFFIWILAMLMTSRNYVVELPYRHTVHRRWKRLKRLAVLLVLLGLGLFFWAVRTDVERPGLMLCLSAVGVVVGGANAWANNVGVRLVNRDEVALTRVHAEFAADVLLARRAPAAV